MKRITRNSEIVWRNEKRREEQILEAMERGEDVSDRGSVILIVSGMMHQLNLVGGTLWNLCDGTRTFDQIVEAMADDFQVERDVLENDVREFVDDLTKRGWLHHV